MRVSRELPRLKRLSKASGRNGLMKNDFYADGWVSKVGCGEGYGARAVATLKSGF